LLEKSNIKQYLIEIGGEIRVRGTNKHHQAWRIAIEKPSLLNRAIQQGIALHNIAVATSGDYRNYYEKQGKRYSHTINPKTGKPITHKLASVTVLHPSAMLADAYATTLMVLGEKEGKVYAGQQNLMVYMIIRQQDGFSVWHNLPKGILLLDK
jgi:thiamine biosynthesis lipoprotein